MTRSAIGCLLVLGMVPMPVASAQGRDGCTTVIVSPLAEEEGRPLLWKNRDASELSNRVVFVREVPYSYLGLVDVQDPSGRRVYAGLNSAGFAVMNSVAYNLPQKDDEEKDLEGIMMADALRTCRSADDFEAYLEANLGPNLGSRANFGVIDADGKAFLFEVENHAYVRHDAAAASEKYLVNTNYARSGKERKGAGYVRFDRATALFKQAPGGKISARDILRRIARDTGNALIPQPTPAEFRDVPGDDDRYVFTRDSINKSYTSAAVVFVGRRPGDPGSRATMWILPGEPLMAIALPLWVEAGSSPDPLWKGKAAALWTETLRIKTIARPFPEAEKQEYLDIRRLDNRAGTGFLPKLLAAEDTVFDRTRAFLKNSRTPAELAGFQDEMARMAFETLRSITAQ